jgi:hypothetical protein
LEFGNPLFVISITSSQDRLPNIGEDQTGGKLEKSNPPLNAASAIRWEPLDVAVDLPAFGIGQLRNVIPDGNVAGLRFNAEQGPGLKLPFAKVPFQICRW